MASHIGTSFESAAAAVEAPWHGPLVVHAEGEESLEAWAGPRRSWIDDELIRHGAILFKGFAVGQHAAFAAASEVLCGRLLDYVYRSTPRTSLADRIYTATEYRADASIPFHNENSYQRTWPM